MSEERSVDRLARYTMRAVVAAAVIAVCWYFRNVIVYIIVAAVVSFLGRPVMDWLRKIRIKGKSAPDWLLAIITLLLILLILIGVFTQIFPVISNILKSVSANIQSASFNSSEFSGWMEQINGWIRNTVPGAGKDFKIQDAAVEWLLNTFKLSSVTSMVGSIASALGSLGIGLFAVIFIGFFFIKDANLFKNIVASLVPDRMEEDVISAVSDIEHLLTRYFGGLLLEVLGVASLNFLGLWLIGRIGFYPAVGIAFITGLLNIIPYLGPWIGGAIGVVLGTVLRFSNAVPTGVYPDFVVVVVTLIAIFIVTQQIDNLLFQPMIYSKSIKSSPLEIFIVLMMAGHVGGIVGMLIAIPTYTVLRVIAARFFIGFKPVRRLIEATGGKEKKPGGGA